jgi:hypothetical protein
VHGDLITDLAVPPFSYWYHTAINYVTPLKVHLPKLPAGSKAVNVQWNESVTFLAHTHKPTVKVIVTVHGVKHNTNDRSTMKVKQVLGIVVLHISDTKKYGW